MVDAISNSGFESRLQLITVKKILKANIGLEYVSHMRVVYVHGERLLWEQDSIGYTEERKSGCGLIVLQIGHSFLLKLTEILKKYKAVTAYIMINTKSTRFESYKMLSR